ncbi:MAG: universal stress protein [Anaerolineae bacterium]|nr:universal stress protein [Anaerolineae bacterium]
MSTGNPQLASAIQDFRRARSRAKLEQVMASLTGASTELLNYEEVRQKLKGTRTTSRGLQDIPINAIVGSVGRYSDFTRSFLPRQDADEGRWAGVEAAMTDMTGLPPVEVYQIGEAYFVMDGNHRVSVAKQLGATHVEAYVTELHTRVPLSPDVQPQDLIVKAEYTEFLERTHLDELRPDADLSMSLPGKYQELEEHISVHRYFMGIDQNREIPYEEAVAHWYDTVYLLVVQMIRENGILRDFPDRTETDLYLWTLDHRDQLGQELAWEIEPEVAAEDLVDRFSPKLGQVVRRVIQKIRAIILPKEITPGPAPGEWRRARSVRAPGEHLFSRILVAVNGKESGWHVVDQALEVARREEGRLVGLHVAASKREQESEAVRAIQAEFTHRCEEASVPSQWIVETGDVSEKIREVGRWLDLVVINLAYPPGNRPIARLSSGLRALIQNCTVPILAIPQTPLGMSRILLAYDDSSKAKEALFVSTYLAGLWNAPLTVVTVTEENHTTSDTMKLAKRYLERHGIDAAYVEKQGNVGQAILEAAAEFGSDLIVMGGYGFDPVLEIVLGSAVDQVLRESRQPVLICR